MAQGLLQILAIPYPSTVWRRFGSWLRTIRPGVAPSEQVVALALRESLPEYILQRKMGTTYFTDYTDLE